MTAKELRQRYLKFFEGKQHKIIPSAPLVPENDATTLFTSSGMQPLIQYFLGEPHPLGKRVVDSQKCFRSQDIEEVGDSHHTTFFEMLGNWSFGDYFKKEQLNWFFEFLTKNLGLDPKRLYVTVFMGNDQVQRDEESIKIWQEIFAAVNIEAKEGERIFAYDVKKNWWSRSGAPDQMPTGEPGGPDSEVFYEFTSVKHDPKFGEKCHPNCDCGRFLEIGNSVFMQYQKQTDGTFTELPQKNVDFGGGLERMVAATLNEPDMFKIDLFWSVIQKIEQITDKKYEDHLKEFRIIADHFKAATFLILDGVIPSNKLQGYVLRRLLRRSMVKMHALSGKIWNGESVMEIIETVLTIYDGIFGINKEADQQRVFTVITDELSRFAKTLDQGLKEINKINNINGKIAFDLYQTYGFPLEITEELFKLKGQDISHQEFEKEFAAHKELSRTASAGMFKGGLTEQTEMSTKYHTATHLLNAALRKILGGTVQQKGSNITAERLRFDFSYPEKLTTEQIKQVEDLVNKAVQDNLPVTSEIMEKTAALQSGALGFFTEKYGDKVTIYTIGHPERSEGSSFSKEICGGPHVKNTGELGRFKITKEESASSGIRRIYATLN